MAEPFVDLTEALAAYALPDSVQRLAQSRHFPELQTELHRYLSVVDTMRNSADGRYSEKLLVSTMQSLHASATVALLPVDPGAADRCAMNVINRLRLYTNELAKLSVDDASFRENFERKVQSDTFLQDLLPGVGREEPRKRQRTEEEDTRAPDRDGTSGAPAGGADGAEGASKYEQTVTDTLTMWFLDHQDHPYPTPEEKRELCDRTGLNSQQLRNWFTNIRKRHWIPMTRQKRPPRSLLEHVLREGAQKAKAAPSAEAAGRAPAAAGDR